MASKAAASPDFYEIAGGTVQHLASGIKADGSDSVAAQHDRTAAHWAACFVADAHRAAADPNHYRLQPPGVRLLADRIRAKGRQK